MTRSIGDYIYAPRVESTERWEECPDCAGHCYLTVILGSGEQVTIPCETCTRGFNKATGRVQAYDLGPAAVRLRIDGMEIMRHRTTYRCDFHGTETAHVTTGIPAEDAFDTEAEALAIAEERAAAEAERQRTTKREPHRSWAWHVTYHRRLIKQAKAELERSTGLLAYAETKAKRHSR